MSFTITSQPANTENSASKKDITAEQFYEKTGGDITSKKDFTITSQPTNTENYATSSLKAEDTKIVSPNNENTPNISTPPPTTKNDTTYKNGYVNGNTSDMGSEFIITNKEETLAEFAKDKMKDTNLTDKDKVEVLKKINPNMPINEEGKIPRDAAILVPNGSSKVDV